MYKPHKSIRSIKDSQRQPLINNFFDVFSNSTLTYISAQLLSRLLSLLYYLMDAAPLHSETVAAEWYVRHPLDDVATYPFYHQQVSLFCGTIVFGGKIILLALSSTHLCNHLLTHRLCRDR